MNEITCPYCEKSFELCQDDGHGCEPGKSYEEECPNCDKTFVFAVDWYPHFTETQADCLNGGEHKFKQRKGVPKEYFVGRERCEDCNEERVDEEANKKAMGEYLDYLNTRRGEG